MLATLPRRLFDPRRRMRIRETDTFLVSYPKSGGSWFYTLLANAVYGGPERRFDLFTAAEHIPDINEPYFRQRPLTAYESLPDPRFFFVHAKPDRAIPRAVCVVRDVRDVLVSYYHWQRMRVAGFDRTLKQFVAQDTFWPCRWDEHVEAWMDESHGVPTLVLRYEDLLADTAGELGRALAFCGLSATTEHLDHAVAASSFDRMRRAEEANEQYAGMKVDKRGRFVRRGKAGSWRDELDAADVAVIADRYGRAMRRVGYV